MSNPEDSPESPTTVLILGAGITGLTTALALLQLHDIPLHVVIHERRQCDQALSGVGGIMIQENAVCCLHNLSRSGPAVVAALAAAGGGIGSAGFITRSGRGLFFSDGHTRTKKSGSPSPGFAITRSRLQRVLYDAVLSAADAALCANVTFHFNSCLVAVESGDGMAIGRFADGSELRADLVVGADGVNSMVRTHVRGHDTQRPPLYSGQTCWAGIVPEIVRAKVPAHLAHYRFAEYWGERGSRFGYFTAGPDELCWYGFAVAERGGSDNGRTRDILRDTFCSPDYCFPDVVREIIETMDESMVYRQDVCDREPPPSKWGKGVITLCGDAAHPMYPSIGQGACMGIEDAVSLVAAVSKALRAGAPLHPALRAFEAARTPRVTRMIEASREITKTASLTNSIARLLRDLAFYLRPQSMADAQYSWIYTDFDPPIIG